MQALVRDLDRMVMCYIVLAETRQLCVIILYIRILFNAGNSGSLAT